MTNEQAISHIRDIICENNTVKHSDMVVFEEEKKALNKAIVALQFMDKIMNTMDEYLDEKLFGADDTGRLPSVQPQDGDRVVSLNAVIDAIEFFQINPQHFDFVNLIDDIKELPSVEPKCEEREKGECPWYAG